MMYAVSALLIILTILILIGIYLYFRNRARKKALKEKYGRVPSHTELYFEEYFDEMIESWDLLKKEEVEDWVDKMEVRLDGVSEDLEELKANRETIDNKLDKVESRLNKMESKKQGR
ncbi:MAG: hypothetical protein KGY76_07665 [Candidatus Thermoplasmatota archaeon]|nr:hypothetical protein [Candidatus Thermoplasmatota archaeon]